LHRLSEGLSGTEEHPERNHEQILHKRSFVGDLHISGKNKNGPGHLSGRDLYSRN
jgi:hypothetical protein